MMFLLTVLGVGLRALFGGTALWISAKLVKNELKWISGVVMALVSSVAELLSSWLIGGFFGGLVGLAVLMLLLYRWSNIDRIYPDGALLVAVAWLVQGVFSLFAAGC